MSPPCVARLEVGAGASFLPCLHAIGRVVVEACSAGATEGFGVCQSAVGFGVSNGHVVPVHATVDDIVMHMRCRHWDGSLDEGL